MSGDENIKIEYEKTSFDREMTFLKELIVEKEKRIDSEIFNLKNMINNIESNKNRRENNSLKWKIALMGLFGVTLGYFVPFIYKYILIIINK